MKTRAVQRGFTLIELLVVIGIIALLAGITVPAFNNMKRSDTMVAATRQMLDDVTRARQLAISKHTTVYMVFVPQGFYSDGNYAKLNADEKLAGEKLYDKQGIGYNFLTLRTVGDQPGQGIPEYLGPWRKLPEGTFIATNKFQGPSISYIITDPPGSTTPDHRYQIYGFSRTNGLPFPVENVAAAMPYVTVPYIAFNYLGQLVSSGDADEYIPLARGTVAHSRDPATRKPRQGLPTLIENPPGNSTNIINIIHIDRLTGRARLLQQELSGT